MDMNNARAARYTITYQTKSATHSFTVDPFITLEFTTKSAALKAAEEKSAATPGRFVRVATPAGNLVKYVHHSW